MIYLGLWILVLGVSVAQTASVTQTTEGWCSPAVGQTHGDVTIICGLDPKVERRLNELLDKKDLELQEKIREAEEWTRKYHELSQRLAEAGKDSELARQAEALLKEGKLEEVGALLDRLIESSEERIASYHCDRAQIFALQFKPIEALLHYEKAYRYRPSNLEYAHAYAAALQHQNRHAEAKPIYQANLKALRELAETTPSTYLPGLATTLNDLAVLYLQTQRFKEAGDALQEGLPIYRQMAQANPPAYLPKVAMILDSLAFLYSQTQRFTEAEKAHQEDLTTYRQLAHANPPVYLPNVAGTLKELAILSLTQGDTTSARAWIADALTINRDLWQNHPTVHGDHFARSFAVKVLILEHMHAEVVTVCEQLHEMFAVASSDDLKQWAQTKMEVSCGEAKQP
jgi:Tetratricopeptide repeat